MQDVAAVYQVIFSSVYRYALKLSKDKEVAEDLCSQTFLKAVRGIRGFRGDASLNSWLCAICKNLYLDQLRRDKRLVPLDSLKELPRSPREDDPAHLVAQQDLYQRSLKALEGLKEPGQQILRLRIQQGMDFHSIGKLYGRSANWACVNYHRARERLRSILDQGDE